VISPEGCASILYRDAERKKEAAEALRITSDDMLELGLIDTQIPEAIGGAHADPKETARLLDNELLQALDAVRNIPADERIQLRYEKFRRMGRFTEAPTE
jgi:acetyl-CoA carboxylase carboxyl transferase subunit alpha